MAERWRLEAEVAARRSEELSELQSEPSRSRVKERWPSANAAPRAAQKSTDPGGHGARFTRECARGLLGRTRHVGRLSDLRRRAPPRHHQGQHVGWAGWVSAWSSGPLDVWVPTAPLLERRSCRRYPGRRQCSRPSRGPVSPLVAAADGDQVGALEVATCSGDRCSPVKSWVYQEPAIPRPMVPIAKTAPSRLGMWTLAGVGASAASSLVLWRAGAFDRSEPAQQVLFQPGNL